jgi:hypothetical protein
MALVLADRVRETSTTVGTGTFTLAGAVTGYASFSVVGNANTTYYCIANQNTSEWEVGIGTYTVSGTTLSRDTVLSNSLGTLVNINFSAGTKDVFVTYPSEKSVNVDASGLLTAPAGLGTGVPSALNTNVGSAGAFVVNGGALGTPSSGTVTHLTGTASININGTVGATTPTTGSFTSLTDSGNLTFTGTGNRITGDFSNTTIANRVAFQTSTTNAQTQILAIPNGTSTQAVFEANSDSSGGTNAVIGQIGVIAGAEVRITSGIRGTGTYQPMTFFTGGSERMRIDTSGNVGIGTSAPAVRLDIREGDAQVVRTSSIPAFGIYSIQAAGFAPALLGLNRTGAASGPTPNSSVLGQVRFDGTDSASSYMNCAYISADIGTNASGGAPCSLSFGTASSGANATDRMRIDSSGNVGIGTSSPIAKLDVNNQIFARPAATTGLGEVIAAASDYLSLPSFTNTAIRQWGSTATSTSYGFSRANLGILEFVNTSTALIATNGGTPIVFATTSAERMRIDSSGNVGIGTSSPLVKLDVLDTGVQIHASDGTVIQRVGYCGFGSAFSGTATNHPYVLLTNDTERMRIDTSGNVGIGTSSPATRLHVDGTIRYTNRPAAGTITAIGFDTNGDLKASSSSLRYKHDIEDYDKGLAEVMQLRPVSFKFNGEENTNIGFIAEEVDALGLTEVMLYNEEEQPEGVIYANMVSLLTKAIQELKAELDATKAKVAALEEK